jgi:hypothetical protein
VADPDRLRRALAAIDAVNAQDPNRIDVRGETRPKELAHAELVSEWVSALDPNASEALLLAARAHHIRRWAIPRSEHPTGRVGYHAWRRALQALHANEVGRILEQAGYSDGTIGRVKDLVRKKGLGRDSEVQVLEDALCLVFLETQFAALAGRLDDEKTLDVTRKTLAKMSPAAILRSREIELGEAERALLARASEPSLP